MGKPKAIEKSKKSKSRKPNPNPAGRKGEPLSLYPLRFEETVSDLLKVSPPQSKEQTAKVKKVKQV